MTRLWGDSATLLPPKTTVPAVLALHIVQLATRWSVGADELLSGLGVSEESLTEPHAQIPLTTMIDLVGRVRAVTGEPGLGVYSGLQARASLYGHVGFAAMSADTLGDALRVAVRYAPTFTTVVRWHLHVQDGTTSLVLEECADFGSARDFFVMNMVVGLWRVSCTLAHRELGGSVDLVMPRPAYYSRLAHLMPPIRFSRAVNQIAFDTALLGLPLVTADRAAMRLELEQCEQELDGLDRRRSIVERVQQLIPTARGGFRSIDDVAAKLHVSPRTLRRKLAAQQTSFFSLLESEQRANALLLLHSSELSIDGIAARIGYSSVQNFTRAFRRWTGTTPAAYRRGRGAV
jgi:AraC-like DNA-binding protein